MKSKNKKVVITGGTGLLASNIALYKRDKWEILLLTRNHTFTFEGVGSMKVNLLDKEATENVLINFKPDLVIHTAGLANVEECEKNYYSAHLANTVTSKNIAQICSSHNYKLVHISTDHFSNEIQDLSTENDIGLPLNVYAETKLLGECEVQRHCPNAVIVRTNFFGWGHENRISFSDFIINNLRKNTLITLFEDVYYTPIFIDELVDSIDALIDKKSKGIFNVVSNKKISKYEFGLKVAEIFSLNQSLIKKGSISSMNLTKRPLNMALSNNKLINEIGSDFNFNYINSITKLKTVEFEGRRTKLIESIKDIQSAKKEQIFYGKQLIEENDVNSVITTLLSNSLTQGPKIEEFEEKITQYTGSRYAVTFANLTCGLHAAYMAAGIGPGDYVVTSPLTFVATSNAALYCGAIPLFADIDPKTLNIDPKKVEELLILYSGKVKAIIVVLFAGHPCDMVAFNQLSKKYNIPIIEDAAHALGGEYSNGNKIGNCENSLITGFSFHPVKNITTGEGCVMTTNDPEVYKQLCRIRSHGITKGNDAFLETDLAFTNGLKNQWYYEMQTLGFNYRLTEIQCALGISQMSKLDRIMHIRRKFAAIYDEKLKRYPFIEILQQPTRNISGNHLYTIKIDYKKIGMTRHEVFERFISEGIHLHVHYIPVFLQPFYKKIEGHELAMNCKNTLDYYEGAATLPLHPLLTEKQIDRVIDTFAKLI